MIFVIVATVSDSDSSTSSNRNRNSEGGCAALLSAYLSALQDKEPRNATMQRTTKRTTVPPLLANLLAG